MMENILDHTKMYRLPYTKNDNPKGWIEITTHCNKQCPGCTLESFIQNPGQTEKNGHPNQKS
jgi:hypothetical protein